MYRDFFYDGQVRRFITQFMRIISNIQVEFGVNRDGVRALQRVPVYYGDSSRQVASILKNNSENMLNAVPALAVYVQALQYDRERVQDPFLISKVRIRERLYDPVTGQYTNQQGDLVTVDRPMPVPYKLTLKADIWTSNTEQKLQLLEQLMVLFNPALEIQNSDNYVDWASLSAVFLTDVTWSSRTVPVGTEEPIDVATMTFEIPIWISTPVAVKQFGVIKKIIASVYDADGNLNINVFDNDEQLIGRKVFTPLNYKVLYSNNELLLLKPDEVDNKRGAKFGSNDSWPALIDVYGQLRNGVSQIRLTTVTGDDIMGTIALNPTDTTKLLFSPFQDTLPANTLSPINAIIDPLNVTVGNELLAPANGTRYLILNDIGSFDNLEPAVVWQGPNNQNFVARANDIIQYNNGWTVSFDSLSNPATEYVTNLTTQIQYRWHGGEWTKSVEGVYNEGEWTLLL
jgi:hypothetical protein